MTQLSAIPLSASVPGVPRIAVMIDGDNIPRSFRPEIDAQARRMGSLATCEVFADISLHSDWSAEAGLEIHHCKGKQGSNAADIALVIAALDLAYRGLAQGFLIVSNDRDFQPLARHLTKIGCHAALLKTPPVKALAKPVAKALALPATESRVVAEVKALIREKGGAEGLPVHLLNAIHAKTGFEVSKTPEKQWRRWIGARPQHFEIDPKGPDSRIRLVTVNPSGGAS